MVAFITAQLEDLAGLVEGLIAERDAERARADRAEAERDEARGLLREVEDHGVFGTDLGARIAAHLGRDGG